MPKTRSADMQRAIDRCESCREVCLQAVAHCLQRGGSHAAPNHITTLLDCADMCGISANFMLRDSALHLRTCEACAIVCDVCAKSCETFPDDEVMRRCGEECRRCADSCRAMVRSTVQNWLRTVNSADNPQPEAEHGHTSSDRNDGLAEPGDAARASDRP